MSRAPVRAQPPVKEAGGEAPIGRVDYHVDPSMGSRLRRFWVSIQRTSLEETSILCEAFDVQDAKRRTEEKLTELLPHVTWERVPGYSQPLVGPVRQASRMSSAGVVPDDLSEEEDSDESPFEEFALAPEPDLELVDDELLLEELELRGYAVAAIGSEDIQPVIRGFQPEWLHSRRGELVDVMLNAGMDWVVEQARDEGRLSRNFEQALHALQAQMDSDLED